MAEVRSTLLTELLERGEVIIEAKKKDGREGFELDWKLRDQKKVYGMWAPVESSPLAAIERLLLAAQATLKSLPASTP